MCFGFEKRIRNKQQLNFLNYEIQTKNENNHSLKFQRHQHLHVYDCVWGISQSNAIKPSHRSLLASKKIYAILIRRELLPFPVYHKETTIDVGQCILQQLGLSARHFTVEI